jgi:hypothetical protein
MIQLFADKYLFYCEKVFKRNSKDRKTSVMSWTMNVTASPHLEGKLPHRQQVDRGGSVAVINAIKRNHSYSFLPWRRESD